MVFPIASVSVAQRQQQSEWAENRNGGDVERPHDRREFLITLPLSLYRIPVDNRTAIPYTLWMIIRSVQHKGLVRFIEDDDSRELRPDLVKRLRNILAVLITAADITKVVGPPGWRIHQLKGDRAGTWSISVSGNWPLTFDLREGEICNLDLEDYH